MESVTDLLGRIHAGEQVAKERLVECLYSELRTRAEATMRNERAWHTLQPTALVHEALVRLYESSAFENAADRRYLFAAATRAMRRVLVDHARMRKAEKRGGGMTKVPIDFAIASVEARQIDVLDLDAALKRLGELSPRQEQVIELRFFGGLSVPEVAQQLGRGLSTIEADLKAAKAFLYGQLTA